MQHLYNNLLNGNTHATIKLRQIPTSQKDNFVNRSWGEIKPRERENEAEQLDTELSVVLVEITSESG